MSARILFQLKAVLLHLLILLAVVERVCADGITFTQYPQHVQYNSTYEIRWSSSASNAVCASEAPEPRTDLVPAHHSSRVTWIGVRYHHGGALRWYAAIKIRWFIS